MVPKPFPYPLGIGVDVCQIHRMASFLRNESLRNRWARKIFTRLEWPALCDQFNKAQRITTDADGNVNGKDWMAGRRRGLSLKEDSTRGDSSVWMLPSLPRSFIPKGLTQSEAISQEAVSSERSLVGVLARHLAGRWAAKEAVIKAHSNRRLYMHDISILNPRLNPGMFPKEFALKNKSVALIEPVCNIIVMDERVAETRGLRGFGSRSQNLQKGGLLVGEENDIALSNSAAKPARSRHLTRRAKVEESDRQIAEVNISHDGDTAVAVCMALDQPEEEKQLERIVDDGEGLPIHEPQWGDEGWFTKDISDMDFVSDDEAMVDSDQYKEALESFFKEGERRIPFFPRAAQGLS